MIFMGRGMMDPAYANVAFSLQDPKKVSKIVESEFGFHIIQLIEKRGDRVNTSPYLVASESIGKRTDRGLCPSGFYC